MSGHSKWSTIKHKKAVTDQVRGKLFSKLSKAISIAVKTGGSPDPSANSKLKMAIEQAKASNMPKVNIERAIKSASEQKDLVEITYEGFGPFGINVIVETATDNKNRTAQEIKSIFEKGGGSLGGPGSVLFNFTKKGLLLVKKENNVEDQILKLIDSGVEDVEEVGDAVEVYIQPTQLSETKKNIESAGFEVLKSELIMKPNSYVTIDEEEKAKKTIKFLDVLEGHDDVQKVFANCDIADEAQSD